MKHEFENDELLAQLKDASRSPKAPLLSEDLLIRVISSADPYAPRKPLLPKLLVSLLGGIFVLAGVFMAGTSIKNFFGSFSNYASYQINDEALLAREHVAFTESDLIAADRASLDYYGASAVGNYVSNHPEMYDKGPWRGEGKVEWVFLVSKGVYFPNEIDYTTWIQKLSAANLSRVSDQLSTSNDAAGIKLLVQDEHKTLHPLIVPVDYSQGSFYLELRDILLSTDYTPVQ